jgi:hypothetical protein
MKPYSAQPFKLFVLYLDPALLNDVYRAGSAESVSSTIKEVRDGINQKLLRCDYEKRLLES